MPSKASITLLLDEKTEGIPFLPIGVTQLPFSPEGAVESLATAISSSSDRVIWIAGPLTQRRIIFASQFLRRLVQGEKIDQRIEIACRHRESAQQDSTILVEPADISDIPVDSHSIWKLSSETNRTVFVHLAAWPFNSTSPKAVAINSSLSALERNFVSWRDGNPLPFRNSLVGSQLRPYMKYHHYFVVASSGAKEDLRGAVWFIERALPLSDDDLLPRQLTLAAETIQVWYLWCRNRRTRGRLQRAIGELVEGETRRRLALEAWSDRERGSIEELFRFFPSHKPKELRVPRTQSSTRIPKPPPRESADAGVQVQIETRCQTRSVSSSCDLDAGLVAGLEFRIDELQKEILRLERLLEQPVNCRWRYLLEKNAELRGRIMQLERLDCRIVE